MGDCDDGYVACASCWFCCHDGLAHMSGHCTLVTVDECVEVGTHRSTVSRALEPSTSVNATVTVAAERAWGWAVGRVAGISIISKLSSMEVTSVPSSLQTWRARRLRQLVLAQRLRSPHERRRGPRSSPGGARGAPKSFETARCAETPHTGHQLRAGRRQAGTAAQHDVRLMPYAIRYDTAP